MNENSRKYKIRLSQSGKKFIHLDSMIVNNESLRIQSFMRNYYFTYQNIYSFIVLEGEGILISHNIPTYPDNFIVYTFKNPNKILKEFKEIGFINKDKKKAKVKSKFSIDKQSEKEENIVLIVSLIFILVIGISVFIGYKIGNNIGNIILSVFISILFLVIIRAAKKLKK